MSDSKGIKNNKRKLIVGFIVVAAIVLIAVAAINIIVDPFLHYHAPLNGLQYSLKDERYENDGIARHYAYEAMITGTSMTQNFMASQMEELWGVSTIKTSFSGASYHELAGHMERAARYNPNLKYVLCSLDGTRLFADFDWDSYEGIPKYLYDNNYLNDVRYFWNVDVLIQSVNNINYTRAGNKTPTMDEYGAWYQWADFSKENAMSAYIKQSYTGKSELSDGDIAQIKANIEENYLRVAKEHPEITFYYFLPPYSELYWKNVCEKGELSRQIEGERLAVSLLLQADNIQVYGFEDLRDITSDLNNYQDTLHYDEKINALMLNDIYNDKHRITKQNVRDYFESVYEAYKDVNTFNPDRDKYIKASTCLERAPIDNMNGQNPYVEGLLVPTYVTYADGDYFIVDCYHDQIIYNNDVSAPVYEWKIMANAVSKGHTLAYDGVVFLADDTENNRILVLEKDYRNDSYAYLTLQVFEDIGVRPHYIQYDEYSDTFYAWSSENGEMYLFRRDHSDNRMYLTDIVPFDTLKDYYIRSFSIIDGYMYFVSGIGHPVISKVNMQDFSIEKEYPVVDAIAGMAQISKIQNYYYITVSTDNTGNQDAATLIRVQNLEDLIDGNYEDIYSYFIGGGTPYCINEINGTYYLTEHRVPGHSVWSFEVKNNGIVNVQAVQ